MTLSECRCFVFLIIFYLNCILQTYAPRTYTGLCPSLLPKPAVAQGGLPSPAQHFTVAITAPSNLAASRERPSKRQCSRRQPFPVLADAIPSVKNKSLLAKYDSVFKPHANGTPSVKVL